MLEEVLNETNTIQNSTKLLFYYGLSIKDDSIKFSKANVYTHSQNNIYIHPHAICLK